MTVHDPSERVFTMNQNRCSRWSRIRNLLAKASNVLKADSKLQAFTDGLIMQIFAKTPDEKVLIFTEYRATQDHLAKALLGIYGADAVYLINGGQDYKEREQAITDF